MPNAELQSFFRMSHDSISDPPKLDVACYGWYVINLFRFAEPAYFAALPINFEILFVASLPENDPRLACGKGYLYSSQKFS